MMKKYTTVFFSLVITFSILLSGVVLADEPADLTSDLQQDDALVQDQSLQQDESLVQDQPLEQDELLAQEQPLESEEIDALKDMDVTSVLYREEINLVTSLEIMSEVLPGIFAGDRQVTIAELEMVAAKLSQTEYNIPDSQEKNSQLVSTTEALKIILDALDYNVIAEDKGGYPIGYLILAEQNKLLSSMNISDELKRSELAKLVYNALMLTVPDMKIINSQSFYTLNGSENFLNRIFNVSRQYGQIVEVNGTALDYVSQIGEGHLGIAGMPDSDKVFYRVDKDYSQYLGYYVYYYPQSQKGQSDKILTLYPSESNKITVINADDLDYDDSSESSISYFDKEKKKSVSIKNARCIYNGMAYPNFELSDLFPDKGYITLLDTGNNGTDVIFVTEYLTITVNSIDVINNKVSGRDGGAVLNLNPYGNIVRIYNEDTLISIDEINRWNVLDYAISKDSTKITVHVSDKIVEGILEESGMGGNRETISIGGESYKLAVNMSAKSKELLTLGSNVTCYLDINGDVFDVNRKSDQSVYGFLMDLDGLSDSTMADISAKLLSTDNSIKVIKLSDKVTFNGARVAKQDLLNADLIDMKNDYIHIYQKLYNGNEIQPQLIKYRLNADGKIIELNTANIDGHTTNNQTTDMSTDSARFSMYGGTQAERLWGNSNAFYTSTGIEFYVSKQTIIFQIPDNAKDMTDDTKFAVTSRGEAFPREDVEYNVSGYDANSQGVLAALVYKNSMAPESMTFRNRNTAFVVSSISTIMDENGNLVQKINGFKDGEPLSLIGADAESTLIRMVSSPIGSYNHFIKGVGIPLRPGDVIDYTTVSNKVKNVALMFAVDGRPVLVGKTPLESSIERRPFEMEYGNGYNNRVYENVCAYSIFPLSASSGVNSPNPRAELQALYGKVVERDGDMVTLEFNSPLPTSVTGNRFGNRMTYDLGSAPVYVCSSKNQDVSITVETYDSIIEGDELFIQNVRLDMEMALVIRR